MRTYGFLQPHILWFHHTLYGFFYVDYAMGDGWEIINKIDSI